MFRRDGGAVGRASIQPLAMLYLKKESKDVPSPQAQQLVYHQCVLRIKWAAWQFIDERWQHSNERVARND
jgi:hypothetical protein